MFIYKDMFTNIAKMFISHHVILIEIIIIFYTIDKEDLENEIATTKGEIHDPPIKNFLLTF